MRDEADERDKGDGRDEVDECFLVPSIPLVSLIPLVSISRRLNIPVWNATSHQACSQSSRTWSGSQLAIS
jgi:hypothetical protein